jgi:predicted N-acetyltransferase YhbS
MMPTDDVRIRPASPGDAAAMRALTRAAYGHYVARMGREPAPMTEDLERAAATGSAQLAWAGDELVGMIELVVEPDAVLVRNVAVSPDAQGSGLGSRLLVLAEERAIDAGVPRVRLYTNEAMTENIAYYGRRGFVETGRTTDDGFHRVHFAKDVRGRIDG